MHSVESNTKEHKQMIQYKHGLLHLGHYKWCIDNNRNLPYAALSSPRMYSIVLWTGGSG